MTSQDSFYSVDEIEDRLSISTNVFFGYRPVSEGALTAVAESGIRRIELIESPEQFDMTDIRSMRVLGGMLNSCGVELGAYHCHLTNFDGVETEEERRDRVDRCRRQIDSMLELGGRLWCSHAAEAVPVVVDSYADLARHVEGTEATIAVENFPRSGVEVADRVAFLDELDHPQVGMILDIGHVRDENGLNPMIAAGGPTRILELCGHRLRFLHLHGFVDGIDHYSPLVEGDEIEWVELFRMLRHKGYQGLFNFEPVSELRNPDVLTRTARAPSAIVARAG